MVFIQIQKLIALRNNDRNKYYRNSNTNYDKHIFWNCFSYGYQYLFKINKTIYYEKKSLELLGFMPV